MRKHDQQQPPIPKISRREAMRQMKEQFQAPHSADKRLLLIVSIDEKEFLARMKVPIPQHQSAYECEQWAFLNLSANPEEWSEFVAEVEKPRYVDWGYCVPDGTKEIHMYQRAGTPWGMLVFCLNDGTLIPVTSDQPWTPPPEESWVLTNTMTLLEYMAAAVAHPAYRSGTHKLTRPQ